MPFWLNKSSALLHFSAHKTTTLAIAYFVRPTEQQPVSKRICADYLSLNV